MLGGHIVLAQGGQFCWYLQYNPQTEITHFIVYPNPIPTGDNLGEYIPLVG